MRIYKEVAKPDAKVLKGTKVNLCRLEIYAISAQAAHITGGVSSSPCAYAESAHGDSDGQILAFAVERLLLKHLAGSYKK